MAQKFMKNLHQRSAVKKVLCVLFLSVFLVGCIVPVSASAPVVSGIWVLNETLIIPEESIRQDVIGIYDGTMFDKLVISHPDSGLRYESGSSKVYIYLENTGGFSDNASRLLNFGVEPQSVSAEFYSWLLSNATLQPAPPSVLDKLLAFWSDILDWFSDAVANAMGMYYSPDSGLTFLGVICAGCLGIGVVSSLVLWILKILHSR